MPEGGVAVDIYSQVLGALNGNGWSTVEDVARRADLPLVAAKNTLTELVGAGTAFVKVETVDVGLWAGGVLVYSDQP